VLEMIYFKNPNHSKDKPSYTARLVWDSLYLEVAQITKGEVQTELGPVPCWIAEGSSFTGLKRKTLHDLKAELEQSLFNEVQKSRGLTAQTLPVESTKGTSVVEAEAPTTTVPRKRTLFGSGE